MEPNEREEGIEVAGPPLNDVCQKGDAELMHEVAKLRWRLVRLHEQFMRLIDALRVTKASETELREQNVRLTLELTSAREELARERGRRQSGVIRAVTAGAERKPASA